MKKDIKVVLWNAANALRAQMDAAEYKHIVLGLVFLKYLSDAFISQQKKIRNTVSDSDKQQTVLENRDYYLQDSMFGVPKDARWENLQAQAKQSDTGTRIDDAMAIIERAPPQLKGKLNKCFGQTQLEQGILGELIDLISNNIKLGGGYDFGTSDNDEDSGTFDETFRALRQSLKNLQTTLVELDNRIEQTLKGLQVG